MNKKQNLLAIALSASFVLAGANVAEANEQVQTENVSQVIDNKAQDNLPQGRVSENKAKQEEKSSLDAIINEEGIKNLADKKVGKSETADAKPLGSERSAANEVLQKSEEKIPENQKASQSGEGAEPAQAPTDNKSEKSTDPNYGEDEKKIQDYSESERYKQTDLQQGNVNQELLNSDENKVKDGFKVEFKNPSATAKSKTEYGYQITIDKETGQRTYTKIYVTDSGLVPAPLGEKPMMGQGDKLTSESPGVTFTPDEKGKITNAGKQRNFNYEASEETLKHINNKDNSSTSFGMKDNYTKDNPGVKFFGDNFALGYKVNPWPNENDKLEQLKLNGSYNDKVFVQGQDIDTGIKVDNIDDNAKERLVGQVYNPNTGEVVPGASAYIGKDGNIHIKMPKGAINEDGTINEESIFAKDPNYKAIQNLDVKFFARPRTAEEFKNIAETPDKFGETGTYTGSGAGTADINHKGTNVKIDNQGIDRYDHYNLIGSFKLNLDDTKFYNQKFKDQDGRPTLDHVFSEVEPGKDFSVNMNDYSSEKDKKEKDEFDKTPEDMKNAQAAQQATGTVNLKFFKENNKGKAPEDQWKISIGGEEINLDKVGDKIYKDDLSNIQITAPSSAKAGEFVAVPIEYTYTNGSNDVHWFHFVVKESDNNIPTYDSEAGTAGIELSQKPIISDAPKDIKKNQPVSYKLANTKYKDDKDNVWNVSIDEKTGEVKATVPDNANIPEKGAKLDVDVVVTYEEEVTINGRTEKRTYTEKTKAQFYSIPSTKQEVKKEFKSELPYKTTFEYDNTIPAGKVVEEGGVVGKQKLVFSQIVVGNKKGALDENGKFVEGKEAVSTEIITPAVDKVIKIGTKPAETTVEIPKGLDYELDYSKKDGEPEVVEEGNDGVVTIKTTRNPQTGEITVTKTTTTEAKNKKIKIPAGTEGTHEYTEKKPFTYDVQFDPDFYKNYPDAKDNYKIVTEGKVGEKTTKWTIKNSKIVGEPEVTETNPTNAVIKVGQKDYTGTITHTESHEVPFEVEYKYSDELEAGQTKVEQKGEKGSYDVEYSQKIKNGEKDGELTSTKKNEKAAKKEIVIIGTKPVTKVVEKPFNTEYVYDENLEAGKTEEVTPGKNGKVTITTSYDKDQKKVVTSETEEKATNRVVKIGGKTNGTEVVKEEIPFEVEVRKDPSLKKGEWKYATDDEGNELKGEKGEQEKTLTIVNSKVTETSEPTVTKKAKKAVILVGEDTNDGTHEVVEKKSIDYKTVIEYDKNLDAGQQEVVKEGNPGEQERTNTLVIKDGQVTETKKGEFKTTKEATDRVVKIGTKPVTKVVEKPFNTEYVYDENLEAGKTEEVTPGKNGKVTITTSYDKDQKKVVTSETEEAGQNRVVKIGGKTDGEFKFESEKAYDIIIRENPDLEAGKHKVVQEGVVGKTETTVKIVNSKEVSRETKIITEKQDKIIEVGTKNVCEIPPVIPNPNPGTPGGNKPNEPGTPGEDKPNEPGTPGETPEKPNEPDTPGEKPNKPGKPGEEKPNELGRPGERPNKPGKPGEPGKENPKTEERPKENSTKEESTREEKNNSDYDMLSRKRKDSQELSRKDKSTNPKTGIGSVAPILTSMGLSIAGLLATKKRKKKNNKI